MTYEVKIKDKKSEDITIFTDYKQALAYYSVQKSILKKDEKITFRIKK